MVTTWLPYCGPAPSPGALMLRWNLDPVLIAAILAFGLLVHFRLSGRERGFGFFALAVAIFLFVSPFCALTSALFAARSAHHVLLANLLAPIAAIPLGRGRRAASVLELAGWTAAGAILFWLWHWPDLYAAALSNDGVYWLMQFSIAGSAIGFWSAVRRSSPAPAIAALLAFMVQMGLLGALLSFSTAAFYAPHFLTTSAWGLNPLEDQQLGGLLMWVPGALTYLLAALALVRRLVSETGEPVPA